MVVTWTTFASTNGVVQYSAEGSNIWLNATAETRLFVDGGSEHTKRYIQRAHLPSLKPSTRYSELFKKYFCFIDVLDVVLSSIRICRWKWLICNPLITFVGYRVGNEDAGWSAVFNFKTNPGTADWSPVVAVYGDLGNEDGKSIGRLETEAMFGTIDMALHIGTF